jgi:3',5'-cyclic AMP phosphodiesterase CpdA
MRRIVHLSDLHFGRVDEAVVAALADALAKLAPTLVVVSGDLTQRARRGQFRRARAFLDSLAVPRLVVPGNHDVPLYDVLSRFLRPLARYRRYIHADPEPFYVDDEIAVAGVNTARSLTIEGGRINREQVDRLRERLCQLDRHLLRIVVTHHPFDVPPGHEADKIVGRATMAMEALAKCGVDVCLAGHLHVSHVGRAAVRYAVHGGRALLVQAGTATSTRARGEVNSFNVLDIDGPVLSIERHAWAGGAEGFRDVGRETFRRHVDGWQAAA